MWVPTILSLYPLHGLCFLSLGLTVALRAPVADRITCRNDAEGEGDASKQQQPAFAAFSPVNIVARGDVRLGHFNVARFTKTVGPFAKVSERELALSVAVSLYTQLKTTR